jgi:magnesium-transporting ATPase (P-type)
VEETELKEMNPSTLQSPNPVEMNNMSILQHEGDRSVIVTEEGPRSVDPKARFASNVVVTSHYTVLSFLPKNLFEQFHEPTNIYFFMIGVLQLIKPISSTQGYPDMWQTLIFIMGISAARALIEDYGKHKADTRRNGALYDVLQPGAGWQPTKAGSIKTGSIIKLKQDQMIPADILFIGSGLSHGNCFLDRANLNGETHLEVYDCIPEMSYLFESPEKVISNFKFAVHYEPPNKQFDEFRGQIQIDDSAVIDVNGSKLLMRETNLRNTEFIYGLVVYTGNDTKIQQSNNSGAKVKIKKSSILKLAA